MVDQGINQRFENHLFLLMKRRVKVVETSFCSQFNHLTRLLGQEGFIEQSDANLVLIERCGSVENGGLYGKPLFGR